MTGVNQLNQKYRDQSAEYLGTDKFEVTAHLGARNVKGPKGWEAHSEWQGKVYTTAELTTKCGKGDVQGLGGANCRHSYWPFLEGISERTYTDEELEAMKPENRPKIQYNGREYDEYQAEQRMREIERSIRKTKRLKTAAEASGDTTTAAAYGTRLRRQNQMYREFSQASGMPMQPERAKVYDNVKSAAGQSAKGLKANGDGATIDKAAIEAHSFEPGEPRLVGRIDLNDQNQVNAFFDEVRTNLPNLDHEVEYTITTDGNCWRVDGSEVLVSSRNIPSNRERSISYHNHLSDETNYSFSDYDVADFIENQQAFAMAEDDEYYYYMMAGPDTKIKTKDEILHLWDEWYSEEALARSIASEEGGPPFNIDTDGFHVTVERAAQELGFKYVRRRKK